VAGPETPWPDDHIGRILTGTAAVALVLSDHLYDPAIGVMEANVSPWIFRQLAQARVFWFDWIFGFAIAASLMSARVIAPVLPLAPIAPIIRWSAGISFAAYLFHMPLLYFFASFLARSQGWLAILLTLTVIGVLGPAAERSKRWWRGMLSTLVLAQIPSLFARTAR
jgi:peptidoglycan/LPS O-acetylase OafA/YrhL